jgi:hypothetical protein
MDLTQITMLTFRIKFPQPIVFSVLEIMPLLLSYLLQVYLINELIYLVLAHIPWKFASLF